MTITAFQSWIDNHQTPGAYLLPHPMVSPSNPIALPPKRATIGRSAHNTIIIDAATVSRRHAVMITRKGNYYVKDMESQNGTFINDSKITISRVDHHDRITFGNQSFLFLKKSDEGVPPATDRMIDANSTIALDKDEIEPGCFLAYTAETARLGLFSQTEKAAGEEKSTNPFEKGHHHLALLYRLSERIRATQKPKEILADGLSLILEAIPPAERAVIMLRSGRGGTLEVAAIQDRTSPVGDTNIQISQTLLDWVLTEKMALMTQNVAGDIRLKASESIQVSQLAAIICVPMIVAGKVIGIVYVDSGNMVEQMTQEDVAFTAAVAHELALTIVNIRLQQSAIRNERMAAIGLTVSNLSHNIKNLTMLNQNAIELMKMHLDRIGDEKTNTCWKIIHHGFQRINKLSVELLAYTSEKELSPVASDINRAILANTDYFEQSLKKNGIQVNLALSDENPRCMIDEQQLQDALLNIVVNAVDAIGNRPDGKIRISTAVEDNRRLVIAVQDNGCGIDPQQKQKIFDLFYTTKGTNGSGLGLPMVVKFIESSGGKLLVTSEPGVGSTFKMVFPLQK
jgi:signal transduction histidine kinase